MYILIILNAYNFGLCFLHFFIAHLPLYLKLVKSFPLKLPQLWKQVCVSWLVPTKSVNQFISIFISVCLYTVFCLVIPGPAPPMKSGSNWSSPLSSDSVDSLLSYYYFYFLIHFHWFQLSFLRRSIWLFLCGSAERGTARVSSSSLRSNIQLRGERPTDRDGGRKGGRKKNPTFYGHVHKWLDPPPSVLLTFQKK